MRELTLVRAVLLAGLAFLGFYIYGLVMGVFSPGELIGFTAVAVGVVVGTAGYAIHLKRKPRDPAEEARVAHEVHEMKQRRGF